MTRPVLLPILGVVVLPASAQAAPVKISPRPSAVSQAGDATVEVANSNRYVLRARQGDRPRPHGGQAQGPAPQALGHHPQAPLRSAGRVGAAGSRGRGTIKLRLRRPDGRRSIAKDGQASLPSGALQAPAGPARGQTPEAPPAGSAGWGPKAPTTISSSPSPAGGSRSRRRPSSRSRARDGRLLPERALVRAVRRRRAHGRSEPTASSPSRASPSTSSVGGGIRTINYKVTGATQEAARVAGTLGMSFSDPARHPHQHHDLHECAGSQSFDAIPAG